jgi:Zn-dependent membrane protease YugP
MKMYIDWTYIVLVLPAVIFSLICSAKVNSSFKKYSGIRCTSGLTGAEAARRVLETNGVYDVAIGTASGKLSDHYDPRDRTIHLSAEVYGSSSVAAIGVACHEAGHAVQHAENYRPLKFRNMIIPATNIGSRLALPLILLGICFSYAGSYFINIAYVGVGCFALSTLFQLVTLPTEFNASRRALKAIDQNRLLTSSEQQGAKKVLSAAAMTYVAALAVSFMQLLRLLAMVSRNDRRR